MGDKQNELSFGNSYPPSVSKLQFIFFTLSLGWRSSGVMLKVISVILSMGLGVGASSLAFAAGEKPSCTTSKCHGSIAVGKVVHPPVKGGECETCHVADEGAKPEKSADKSPEKSKKSKLPTGHAVFKPLSFPQANETCLMCHDGIAETIKKAVSPHSAVVDSGCTACHDPHHSAQGKLLKVEVPKLCFGCHDAMETLLKENENQHPPVTDCLGCHQPHGGANRTLLKEKFTDKNYLPFDEKEFALCFSCHDAALITKETVSEETGFRNGKRNMHFFHIRQAKKWGGRSCRVCHELHASKGPKLIRTKTVYREFEIPMKYEPNTNGGGCTAACHTLKKYDRLKPVENKKGR